MSIDIKSTLQNNINSNNALALAADIFPGPIQTAINSYLNGITIPLGSAGSLSVSKSGANLALNMSPVAFTGTASADQATLKIAGTDQYADAFIEAKFTNKNGAVAIDMNATMGQNLQWNMGSLWPSLFNSAPFNQVGFAKGTLALTTNGSVKFTGTGTITYNSASFANGALVVLYKNGTQGLMMGVVVANWSPGSIWAPLRDVTFKQSGLLFSSMSADNSATLGDLGLINASQVPSIVDGKFKITPGVTFFTTLELKGFLGPLALFLGNNTTLALYANQDPSGKLTLMAKFGSEDFSPGALFQFDGFELDWVIASTSSYDLVASANGLFYPPDGSSPDGIGLSLAATIKPAGGDIDLSLSVNDWVHPFGYDKLTVKEFEIDISLGATSQGSTIGIMGDFQFTVTQKGGGTKSFEFGVAGEITDFTTVTGVAFLLKADSPGQKITLGDMMQAITSVEVYDIPVIEVIDEILQIGELAFAVVESDSLRIGDRTFNQGFTLNADFDILNQENVVIDVEVTGKGVDEEFSGQAEMKQPVEFSKILTLCAYNGTTKQPDCTKGPQIAVSSKGVVVPGVNNDQPVYFYASCYVQLFDIVRQSLYGIATTDGMFKFAQSVSAGTKAGDNGVWAGQEIWVGVDPKNYGFTAGFDFNFGWKNQSIGPLTVFGVDLIPAINLPDFSISAGLGVNVDGKALTFELLGEFSFSFLGIDLNFGGPGDLKSIFSINLGSAPETLAAIRAKIWQWLLDNIKSLLEGVLNVLDKFVAWVEDVGKQIGLAAAKIADILADTFNQTAQAIADVLKDIGYAASEVYNALVSVGKFALSEIEKVVDDLYTTAKNCAVDTAGKLGLDSASSASMRAC